MARNSRCCTPAAALGWAAAGVLLWSTVVERRLFTIRRHELPILPSEAAPVRVLQLSDLHLAPWQTNKINWVRSLAELKPDLVVLTGDLMGHVGARPALLHALSAFEGVPTVFVHGSNDYYGPKFKNPLKYLREPSRLSTREQDIDNAALTSGLTALGFTDLNNSATSITLRGTEIEFFGLNDPHIRFDDPDEMRASMGAAGVAQAKPGTPRIGVVHAPYQSALGALLGEGADAILAGHTHGGQVRVPGIGALTSNSDLPPSQARGLSVWYDAHRAAYLNVSAGLGNSIYAPVRFACRPEASLLTLTPPTA
ncbi:putative MPP superfamily phosphohydrolase [Leucobacter komagatae]|uniref:Putative MPP superfamily phosphohydrolase n=1 Tax=Leucobacter komagatae TaxID=55969 RepID=A0A542Y979_9MICO|nr:metallophosphoesterase [Leucobacter komagatae]TQL44544.1 putative MPP superfamily phosphohydrolase [Leucobacter komagatae]